MKKIGLVGGISWTSTIDYYRFINEETNKQLGSLNFAECMIYSLNFEHFRNYNAQHDWDKAFELLLKAVAQLEKAGAELVMLGANTAHIVAERIARSTPLPLIDIRTATANAIKKCKLKKVGLLGTVYTMELDFYRNKLSEYEIETIIPQQELDRQFIENNLLYELGKGIVKDEAKRAYIRIANQLIEQGAEGIILGCTEIPLILKQEDLIVPVFNTTEIHAQAAVAFALTS